METILFNPAQTRIWHDPSAVKAALHLDLEPADPPFAAMLLPDDEDWEGDESPDTSDNYGSLLGLSLGKRAKKPVLVLDPDEAASAAGQFQLDAVQGLAETGKSDRICNLAALEPMDSPDRASEPAQQSGGWWEDDPADAETQDPESESLEPEAWEAWLHAPEPFAELPIVEQPDEAAAVEDCPITDDRDGMETQSAEPDILAAEAVEIEPAPILEAAARSLGAPVVFEPEVEVAGPANGAVTHNWRAALAQAPQARKTVRQLLAGQLRRLRGWLTRLLN